MHGPRNKKNIYYDARSEKHKKHKKHKNIKNIKNIKT
jgi:hypothetical protein